MDGGKAKVIAQTLCGPPRVGGSLSEWRDSRWQLPSLGWSPRLGSKASKVRLAGLTAIAVVERAHSATHRTQQTEVSSVLIWVVALGDVSEGRRGASTRIDG